MAFENADHTPSLHPSFERHALHLFNNRHILVHRIKQCLQSLHFLGMRFRNVTLFSRIILKIEKLHRLRLIPRLNPGMFAGLRLLIRS